MKDKDKLYISRLGEINTKEGWLKWGQESSDFIGAVFDRKTKNTVYITMPWEKIVRLLKLEEYYE